MTLSINSFSESNPSLMVDLHLSTLTGRLSQICFRPSPPYRRCQLATESDRRRLLRRCLNEWQLWCRRVREQRELLAQQEETRCKMAALINAAAAGKLKTTEPTANEPSTTQPETSGQPKAAEKVSGMPRNLNIQWSAHTGTDAEGNTCKYIHHIMVNAVLWKRLGTSDCQDRDRKVVVVWGRE